MPTPFTHLAAAQRLLIDSDVAPEHRELLRRESGAFLLGSIAADARVESGTPRLITHFYNYAQQLTPEPVWSAMLNQHPSLWTPQNDAHAASIAGYIAHLSVDEVWSRQMVGPHFVARDWGSRDHRFVMLHVILIVMDERDELMLESWQAPSLASAVPRGWLPFISDDSLIHWRDLIYDQIRPGGRSQTLKIFGGRAKRTPAQLRALLDSPEEMQVALWRHIPKRLLAETEIDMYAHAVTQMGEYLAQAQIAAR